jgi:aryl-alcohol dehydrogenase-like predicted oxidoreductase
MKQRRIGGRMVSAIGFGQAGLSVENPPPPEHGRAVVRAAFDAGVTLFDTATCYVPSHLEQGFGERLLTEALAGTNGTALIASKAGIERINTIEFSRDYLADGSPAAIRRHCETTLGALGAECIDLYQLHAPDPNVPLSETMGAFRDLRDEGKIELVGVCNVGLEQLEEARSVVDIASVQNKFSPAHRESADVLTRCAELDIAFLAYSPLGGLGDRARDLPVVCPAFAEVAVERGVSPHRVALAWELALAPVVIPLVGARRFESIQDSALASELELTPSELERLAA